MMLLLLVLLVLLLLMLVMVVNTVNNVEQLSVELMYLFDEISDQFVIFHVRSSLLCIRLMNMYIC